MLLQTDFWSFISNQFTSVDSLIRSAIATIGMLVIIVYGIKHQWAIVKLIVGAVAAALLIAIVLNLSAVAGWFAALLQ